ncbi:MAG TPA: YceI family protein [Bryobacteraceae bacterium]|nr:YceI family protein [Bryobacteraceae bacterium]
MVKFLFLAAAVLAPAAALAQIPTFDVIVPDSKVGFHVDASVSLTGIFEKWVATLKFLTPRVESGVLDIVVDAASVNAGSSLKENKLRGRDFFNVKEDPEIRFHSKKIINTARDSYRVDGDFTIRGFTKEESLMIIYSPDQPDEGRVRGQMVFDRKQYGMTHGIPLVHIADRVEVNVDMKIHRTGGPRPIQSAK